MPLDAVCLGDGQQKKEHIGQLVSGDGICRHLGGQVDPAIVARDVSGHDAVRRISKRDPAHVSFDSEQATEDP